nr:bromodomain and WD repeat-containing protein 3 [Tanacetum cinerariifolium]
MKKSVTEPAPPARDPRDVETIKMLQHQIQELEFQQLQQDSPAEEMKTEFNVWDDGSEDINPFGGGNPLLTKKTESKPIIWAIGDEEEEHPFVNKYPSFKEEPIMFVENELLWNACKPNNDDPEQPNHEIDVVDGHENDV